MLKKEFLVAFAVSIAITGANLFMLFVGIIMYDTVSSTEGYEHIKSVVINNFTLFSLGPALIYYFLHIKKAIKILTPKIIFGFLASLLFLPLCLHILVFIINEQDYNCYGAGRFENKNSIYKNLCIEPDYSKDYTDY